MKNLVFRIILFLLLPQFSFAQMNNFVETKTILGNDTVSSIQYFDGIGRASVSASNGISGSGNFVYGFTEYNLSGLESRKWFSMIGGHSVNQLSMSDIANLSSTTYNQDTHAYCSFEYDGLQQRTVVFNGGNAWYNNVKNDTLKYTTNSNNEVKLYRVVNTVLEENGFWPESSLSVINAKDEDGHETTTYKDLSGNVVLQVIDNSKTYYVYDEKNLLTYVLTPQYQTSGDIDADAYQYQHDSFGRIISKKLPGCESAHYKYTLHDRIKTEQTPLLAEQGLIRFFFYDVLGRLCIQGVCSEFDERVSDVVYPFPENTPEVAYLPTGYVPRDKGYSNDDPKLIYEIINYYDNYEFLTKIPYFQTNGDDFTDSNFIGLSNSMGALTGQIVATSDGNMLYNVFYYDQKGRVIDERHSTLSNKVYKVFTDYSFTDKPMSVTKVIPVNGGQQTLRPTINPGNTTETYTLTTKYTYNQYNDQLEAVWVEHDNDSTCVSQITYNNLGQIQSEMRPQISDAVNYEYDLHGWTKSIDSDYFKERLHYADGPDTDYYCYNGDISSQLWMNADTAVWRGYKFKYNERDMLYQSSYGEGENLTLNTGRYNENITEFNSNGGIVRLSRKGKNNSGSYGMIDNLIYDYDGNKVTGIRDRYPTLLSYNGAFEYRNTHTATAAEPDFEYNSAGMLIKDRDKGISRITYNNIGLVDSILFDNGARIASVYSMTGEKLKVTHVTPESSMSGPMPNDRQEMQQLSAHSVNTTREYLGGDIEIEGNSMISTKSYRYHFGNGYMAFTPGTSSVPTFYHYTKDHLGNVRSVVRSGNNGPVEVQRAAYYPFGGVIPEFTMNLSAQDHLYNGKELDTSNNLWWYDYGARQYDPTAPRFTTPDPLAEKYYPWNYYTYCVNNPVKNIDPDGRAVFSPLPIIPAVYAGALFMGYAMERLGTSRTVKTIGFGINHPIIAYNINEVQSNGSISNIASNFEINIAKGCKLKRGTEGDPGNAIRHTLWQSIITKEYGSEIANRVGLCHEDNIEVANMNHFSNINDADSAADLKNNAIGRSIGKSNPDASNNELAKKVMYVYYTKGLYVVNNDGNAFTVNLQKITKEQYEKAIEIINQKGNDGLNK